MQQKARAETYVRIVILGLQQRGFRSGAHGYKSMHQKWKLARSARG
jgi:hypothetical protein